VDWSRWTTARQGMAGKFKGGVRWVRRATSPNFVNRRALEPIQTGDAPREQFYTNGTIRYERAHPGAN
jgi:hypothetical protein